MFFKCILTALVEGILFAPVKNSEEGELEGGEGEGGRSENGSKCQYGCLCLLTPVLILPSRPDSSLSSYQEMKQIHVFRSLK